jgi:GT2 family glycosyltransferase
MIATEFPRVSYHHLEENHGPAYARNRALELVATPYVAFFDSDIELTPQWAAIVNANLDAHTILACRVDRPDGSFEWGPRKTVFWGGSTRCRDEEATVASSNNMVIPTSLGLTVKFAEELRIYYEDTYFCVCALRKGFRLHYLDRARVIHHHNSQQSPSRTRQFVQNRTYIMIRDAHWQSIATLVQIAVTLAMMASYAARIKFVFAIAALRGLSSGIIDVITARRQAPVSKTEVS